jgi:hypothetical protein
MTTPSVQWSLAIASWGIALFATLQLQFLPSSALANGSCLRPVGLRPAAFGPAGVPCVLDGADCSAQHDRRPPTSPANCVHSRSLSGGCGNSRVDWRRRLGGRDVVAAGERMGTSLRCAPLSLCSLHAHRRAAVGGACRRRRGLVRGPQAIEWVAGVKTDDPPQRSVRQSFHFAGAPITVNGDDGHDFGGGAA